MFINYEHNNHVYNVTVEKKDEDFFVTYNNTEYKLEAEEIKPGHLKIKIGDRVIKSVITEGNSEKFVFVDGNVFKVKPVELTAKKKSKKKKEEGDLSSPISGKIVDVKVKKGDKVIYAKYSGTDIKDESDEDYLLLTEKDVLAILK